MSVNGTSWNYSRLPITRTFKENPGLRKIENSSSYREREEDGQEYGKNSYCTVNILITLNCLCLIVEMLNENWKILLDYKPGVVNR